MPALVGPTIKQCLSARFRAGNSYGIVARTRAKDYYLRESREEIKQNKIWDALFLLEARTSCFIKKDLVIARMLLDEAQKVFEKANAPQHFHWGLRIAAHNVEIGRETNAKALFDRVLGYIDQVNQREQDDIRFAAAMTYNRLGKMEEAVKITHSINDLGAGFRAVLEIAGKYLKDGDKPKAVKTLLTECLQVAEMNDPNGSCFANAERLLEIAKKLVEIDQKAEAELILDKAVACLPEDGPRDWWTGIPFAQERLEEITVLLVKMGRRQTAIDLAVKTIVGDIRPEILSPRARFNEQLKTHFGIDDQGLEITEGNLFTLIGRWPKLARALQSS